MALGRTVGLAVLLSGCAFTMTEAQRPPDRPQPDRHEPDRPGPDRPDRYEALAGRWVSEDVPRAFSEGGKVQAYTFFIGDNGRLILAGSGRDGIPVYAVSGSWSSGAWNPRGERAIRFDMRFEDERWAGTARLEDRPGIMGDRLVVTVDGIGGGLVFKKTGRRFRGGEGIRWW